MRPGARPVEDAEDVEDRGTRVPRPAAVERTPADSRVAFELLTRLLGPNPPVRIELWDGTAFGPDTATRVVVRTPEALRRVLFRPGELGFARAFVAGEIDVSGDIFEALELRHRIAGVRPTAGVARGVGYLLRRYGMTPPQPPAEEARLRGRRHTWTRDAAAISHHYDVSNEFYALVLGESMTYSCGVWSAPPADLQGGNDPAGADSTEAGIEASADVGTNSGNGLAQAQRDKHELVCRKLGLQPGMRMLDVGCGWGSLLLHAAGRHGVHGVGVTISEEQAAAARRRVEEAGLDDRIEIRLQDYRAISDGPFDTISSIGMVEHVGRAMLPVYFSGLFRLLRARGRLLNQGISFPGDPAGAARPRPHLGPLPLPAGPDFLQRYVFPDGELHEIGSLVTLMQEAGFEVRHVENLREHYGLTLRAWVANLERNWDAAVAAVGAGRARVWRLYMAGSALSFESGKSQLHQVLAVRPDAGHSGMPLRPSFDGPPEDRP
jgi:cyclopropane-fatty-acyl-phospholipid synthase